MPEAAEPAIGRANRIVAEHGIEGWVCEDIHHVVKFADDFHVANNITGDIVEIGIHHGRLFFILAAAARGDEKCIAVDLFDQQELNVDSSGRGSKDAFLDHANHLFPEILERLHVVAGDSMGLTIPVAPKRLGTDSVRLFSVDGGHTVAHVVNDLTIAQELLVGGGLVLLDDFFGPHWPSVTEGLFRFMADHNRRLAPIMIFQNKLFLTTYSEHALVLDGLTSRMGEVFGDSFDQRFRRIDLCGHQVLGFF